MSRELGREVFRRRTALGLTVQEVAEKSGLSVNFIGQIIKGRQVPSEVSIRALAKGLDCHPADLFGGAQVSPAALEAAKKFDTCPPEAQEHVLALLEILARHRKRPPPSPPPATPAKPAAA